MANKRHRPEEIVTKLRQVEVLVEQGKARIDAIREVRITGQTFYRWRRQYGGMGTGRNLTQLDPYLLKFPSIFLFNKDCFHRHFSFSTLYILAPIV